MILTLNNGKLVVNVPVAKYGGIQYYLERKKVLENLLDEDYFVYSKSIDEGSYESNNMRWSLFKGQTYNSVFKYDFDNNLCHYKKIECLNDNYIGDKIEEYMLLQPHITNFCLNGDNTSKSIRLLPIVRSNNFKRIDFILTCKDDEIKKALLYDRHHEFATMYYEIMPNIDLKSISEYPISSLQDNEENKDKIYTAKNNNKVLQLLRK